jgi:hypothetical protein
MRAAPHHVGALEDKEWGRGVRSHSPSPPPISDPNTVFRSSCSVMSPYFRSHTCDSQPHSHLHPHPPPVMIVVLKPFSCMASFIFFQNE